MPTIATMFNSGLPPYSMAGYTTKTVQGSYLKNGFSNKWSGQGTSHCHMETPLEGRPENQPFSAKQSRESLFPRNITNPQICHPRSFGTFKRELSNQHHTIIISVSTWVSIWAPYHDTTLFQKEWSYPREAIPENLAAQFLFRPLPVCEARRSHVHKNTLYTKAVLWVNKWS